MTRFTFIPKIVKVLEVFDDWQWDRKRYTIKGHRLIIGKYYVAEHSKTPGLNKGDCFVIDEVYDKYGR